MLQEMEVSLVFLAFTFCLCYFDTKNWKWIEISTVNQFRSFMY